MQIEPFEPADIEYGDFYSKVSITLGEWYEHGFYKPDDESWHWDAYSDEQYSRVCKKFLDRYYFREVSIFTPAQWKLAYLRKLNEIMPKYKLAYARLEQGLDFMQEYDDYEKSRDIFSDFPATQLSGNADYTSTGTDRERELVHDGPAISKFAELQRQYNDVDVMILDDLEPVLFSGLMSVQVPLF